MSAATDLYDLTILGGGLAGLTLAQQLLRQSPEVRVLILEKRAHPVREGAFKVGESTVEVGAYYLSEEVGLKKHLVDDQLPKFGLRFFFNNGQQSLTDYIEVGLSDFFPAPGFQVDRGRLENYLVKSVTRCGARFMQRAVVQQVELVSGGGLHQITYADDGGTHQVRSRWVIDASGRTGILKKQLGLSQDIPHHVNAAWFRIGKEIRVDQWCEDSGWQSRAGKIPRRWLSTNHLLGRGYWVWIIPLASGATSIGIVADPRLHPLSHYNQLDAALTWLEKHEPLCAATILPDRHKIQDFRAIKQLGYSCRKVFSSDRWALTGESGVFLDPLYSPGIDYIAIGNTMICSLIEQDREGHSMELLATRYQGIFMALFHDNLTTYQDQYPLFGNPRVMSLKYVWDYALYWSFPALLYLNGKLTDPRFFGELGPWIEILRGLNKDMQRFLRDWDHLDDGHDVQGVFVDQNEITILRQLNGELRQRLDDDALKARFQRNVGILQDLAAEIASRVMRLQPTLEFGDQTTPAVQEHRLDGIFAALDL